MYFTIIEYTPILTLGEVIMVHSHGRDHTLPQPPHQQRAYDELFHKVLAQLSPCLRVHPSNQRAPRPDLSTTCRGAKSTYMLQSIQLHACPSSHGSAYVPASVLSRACMCSIRQPVASHICLLQASHSYDSPVSQPKQAPARTVQVFTRPGTEAT